MSKNSEKIFCRCAQLLEKPKDNLRKSLSKKLKNFLKKLLIQNIFANFAVPKSGLFLLN